MTPPTDVPSDATPDPLAARLRALDADAPPPGDAFDLARAVLVRVGDPDPALRDDLFYATLARWLRGGAFDCAQLGALLDTLLDDEHLFFGLGGSGDDGVFTRSFSVLLVPQVLAAHRASPCLAPERLAEVRRAVVAYLRGERDLRGFVEGRGWAHAVAHGADAVTGLMLAEETGRDGALELLAAVRDLAGATTVYAHGEDERLARPVAYAMLRDDLGEGDLTGWVRGFEALARERREGAWPEGYRGLMNVKHVLGALYFLLKRNDDLPHQGAVVAEIDRVMDAVGGL